jgi:hypothetical protein
MNLLLFLRNEAAFYWAWWLCFLVIAFCGARWFWWFGVVASALIISALILGIEVHSVFQDMREHPDWGRDADFVFWFGVLCRIVIYNIFFLPVSIVGLKLRKRTRHATGVA